jgi:calcium-dependent protein kinase
MINETSILASIDHPNIVKIFECFQDEANYYLISEYCDGGELFEKLRNFRSLTETSIAFIIKNILSAITYCHKKGIVHRDLKPENILFDTNQNVKVIDFGASAKLLNPSSKLDKRIGTV